MNIRKEIVAIINKNMRLELNENDNLKLADMGINSLMFIQMVIVIEEVFHFNFSDNNLNIKNFIDINSICNYVENNLKNKS